MTVLVSVIIHIGNLKPDFAGTFSDSFPFGKYDLSILLWPYFLELKAFFRNKRESEYLEHEEGRKFISERLYESFLSKKESEICVFFL